MHRYEYIRPADQVAAIAAAARATTAQQGADVRFLGGGTTLIDLMKLNVETPTRVLDINRLPLDRIDAAPGGGLRIGAIVRNSDLANDAKVQQEYSVLSQAILQGASAQIRNMATVGGTCCSEHAACTSGTRPWRATSASQAADVRQSPATIEHLPSWARANNASRRIHPTCASRWQRWRPPFTFREQRAHVPSPSAISIFCPAIHHIVRPCLNPAI